MAQRRYPTRRQWHPILNAREYQTGKWALTVVYDRVWALIDIVRLGDEVGYMAVREADHSVIGYFTSLRAAAAHSHAHYIASLSPKGNPQNLHGATEAAPPNRSRAGQQ